MTNPTYGFRTLKGKGARLLRGEDDDWVNVLAREGLTGWKRGLLFTRHYAYQQQGTNGAQHLYRYECLRLKGLDQVAVAYGKKDEEAREALYRDLKRKGVMPDSEEQ
jgi:hypothetical protein